MRNASIIATAALTLGACQVENELRFVSTLDAETNGVVLADDGNNTHVGMEGMTCTVSTEWGCPIDDADLPTTEERVLDHFEGQTLATSIGGLHTIDSTGWQRDADISVTSVRAARYAAGGLMVLRGDARACFVQQGAHETAVPGNLCTEDLDVEIDRADSALYTAASDGVYAIEMTGAKKVSDGDLAAWDPALRQLYTATAGETVLTASKRRGAEVWTVDLGLPILSIAARGNRGQVVVLAEAADEFGSLFRLNGVDGSQLGVSDLPDSEGSLEVSGNGKMVAIVRDDEVHFFSMVLESEGELDLPEKDPVACLQDDRIAAD